MRQITPEGVRKIVRDIFAELGLSVSEKRKPRENSSRNKTPRVLIVFHAGVRKLEEALKQTQMIEESAGKSGVFTGESARRWVCGEDVRERAGARCILDTVKPEGLEKVLELADILVLPTFCFKVAAKVARLTCDDQESNLVLSALLQGKRVLASRDGFLVCDILANEKIRQEIQHILNKLEDFGMVFCPTEKLNAVFQEMVATGQESKAPTRVEGPAEEISPALDLITAKHIHATVNDKQDTIRLAPGGKVTPLARDLAKEYSVKIVET